MHAFQASLLKPKEVFSLSSGTLMQEQLFGPGWFEMGYFILLACVVDLEEVNAIWIDTLRGSLDPILSLFWLKIVVFALF
jgi:hypothetical protein